MSAIAIEPPSAAAPYRRPPALVIVAFYLWWPLIIGQSITLAYLALTLAQAARVGGPAWDVLFVDPPIAFSLLLMIAVEVAFVVQMRGGSQVARVVLLVLGTLNAAFAFLVGIPATGTRMPVVQTTAQVLAESVAVDLALILNVLAVLAVAASLLPFIGPASRYFWKPPRAADPATAGDPTMRVAGSRRRRAMPWPVLVAFILWWPLILIEALGLVILSRSIAQYIGNGMASVVTLLFAVGVGLPLLAMIAAEIPLVLFLRRGSNVARWWLLTLAIPMGLLTAWPAVTLIVAEIGGTDEGLGGGPFIELVSMIGAVVAVLALAVAVLPFLPPANRYFSTEPGADAATPSANPVDVPTGEAGGLNSGGPPSPPQVAAP